MNYQAPEEDVFKGYPVLKIAMGKKYKSEELDYFIIGIKKARLICDQIDYIRRFLDKHEAAGKGVA